LKRVKLNYFLCFSIILVSRTLHAQAPAGGAQASPPPAATATVSATDAKPNEPAKPLEAAAQLYRTGKLTEAEAAYKAILQSEHSRRTPTPDWRA
jgi:TolA-binding protein